MHHNHKHGMAGTKIYCSWYMAIRRCHDNRSNDFPGYGERGISVCERWHDFANFYSDMGESYKKHCSVHGASNTTIDRIDNTKGYDIENCRWATKQLQSKNRRRQRVPRIRTLVKDIAMGTRERLHNELSFLKRICVYYFMRSLEKTLQKKSGFIRIRLHGEEKREFEEFTERQKEAFYVFIGRMVAITEYRRGYKY